MDWKKKVISVSPNQYLTPARPERKVQATVMGALYNDKQLRVTYRGAEKTESWNVSPLGIVMRGPVIYLVCTFDNDDSPRLLAMHRIKKAAEIEDGYVTTRGFNLRKYRDEGFLDYVIKGVVSGSKVTLEAEFERRAAQNLSETPLSKDQEVIPLNNKTSRVTATVRDTLQLRWWLLAYGPNVKVLAPPEIRDWIAAKHKAAASLYRR